MLEEAIVTFLKKHHLLTLATSQENVPYCASCFYAFDDKHATFIIATETKTRHAKEALYNSHVAGTVALETKIVGKIQEKTGKTVDEIEDTIRNWVDNDDEAQDQNDDLKTPQA